MNSCNFRFTFICIINLYFLFPVSAQTADKPRGIYDGNIGSDKIILVTESTEADFMKGHFLNSEL